MELEEFELVLLRSPEQQPSYDDETRAQIQREHLAFHQRLRAAGDVVVNGPLLDQPDPALRGLTFYRVGSVEQARSLAEQDPAVRAGVLVVDVARWWCPPDLMRLPGKRTTVG